MSTPIDNKPWTPADDERLRNAQVLVNDLIAARNRSVSTCQEKLTKWIDKAASSHEYDLRGIVQLITNNRWVLAEILTGGEYSKLMALRQLRTDAANAMPTSIHVENP